MTRIFLIDTGGVGGTLGFSSAFQSRLAPQRAAMSDRFRRRHDARLRRQCGALRGGPLLYPNMWFSIAPDQMLPADLAGSIQPHIWTDFDIEIDFVAGKLNMFVQKQCPGHVVYWTHDAVAAVPMKVYPGRSHQHHGRDRRQAHRDIHRFRRPTFDDEPLPWAKAMFGIDEKNPRAETSGHDQHKLPRPGEDLPLPVPGHQLRGDFDPQPRHPHRRYRAGSTRAAFHPGHRRAAPASHLFIAYDENVLYLTSAEAR